MTKNKVFQFLAASPYKSDSCVWISLFWLNRNAGKALAKSQVLTWIVLNPEVTIRS